MLGRYVAVAVVVLLAAAWAVAAVYGYVRLRAATDLAESVSRGTTTFQHELEQPRAEILNQRSFAENVVVNAVKSAWRTGIKVTTYPPEILYSPAASTARARGR